MTNMKWMKSAPPTLKEAQEFVGGLVQMIDLPSGQQLLVNEEGLLKDLPLNFEASELAGHLIVGPALVLTDDAKEFLIRKGNYTEYGARPLRRAIENFVEDPLSEELLRGEFVGKDTIVVDGHRNDDDKIVRLKFQGETTAGKGEAVGAGADGGESDDS